MSVPPQDWIQSLVDQIIKQHICAIVLLEWFLPDDGKLQPVVRKGEAVISRISFSPVNLAEGNDTRSFQHKFWSLENRFDKRTVSDHPAVVRVSLDYLVFSESKMRVDVKSQSRTFDAARLAAGDPYETGAASEFVVRELVRALGGPEMSHADYTSFMSALNLRLHDRPYTPKTDMKAHYSGDQSLWLDERFESLVSAVRLSFGTDELWDNVYHVLDRLYRMLNSYHLRRGRDIRNALRPMTVSSGQRTVLQPLDKLYQLREPVQDALFSWTTETMPAQVAGHVTLAPQTHYVWCTKRYLVMLDIRICRDDWYSGLLLPDLYLFIVDMSRELAYAVYMNQLPVDETVSASAAMLEFVTQEREPLMLMLALSNVRLSVPRLIRLEKLSDVEVSDLEFRLPKWFDERMPVIPVSVRRVTDIQRGSFRFRILQHSFGERIREVIYAFLQAAYTGVRLRVNYDSNKSYLLDTHSPALLGFVCGINRVNGRSVFFPYKAYHNWMRRAFSSIEVNPWHVLAWRFFDIAVTAGLTSRYARYLWRLDPQSMETMFCWRTLAADAGLIPVIGDASALHPKESSRYESWALLNHIPARHFGRALDITPEQFEQQVIDFSQSSFTASWPAMKSMLELVLSED